MLENCIRYKQIFPSCTSFSHCSQFLNFQQSGFTVKKFPWLPTLSFLFPYVYICLHSFFYATPQRMQKAAKIKKKAVCKLFFLNANVYLHFCCPCFPWSVMSFITDPHKVVIFVSSLVRSRIVNGVKWTHFLHCSFAGVPVCCPSPVEYLWFVYSRCTAIVIWEMVFFECNAYFDFTNQSSKMYVFPVPVTYCIFIKLLLTFKTKINSPHSSWNNSYRKHCTQLKTILHITKYSWQKYHQKDGSNTSSHCQSMCLLCILLEDDLNKINLNEL